MKLDGSMQIIIAIGMAVTFVIIALIAVVIVVSRLLIEVVEVVVIEVAEAEVEVEGFLVLRITNVGTAIVKELASLVLLVVRMYWELVIIVE